MRCQRTAKEKELAEVAYMLRAWKRWHREELETALNGRHGSLVTRLMEVLRSLTSASTLVDFIKGRNWQAVDANTKLVILHELNCAITRLRERSGLEPVDDPLPGQRDNVFRTIKTILFPPAAAPTGANAGHMTNTTSSIEGTTS